MAAARAVLVLLLLVACSGGSGTSGPYLGGSVGATGRDASRLR